MVGHAALTGRNIHVSGLATGGIYGSVALALVMIYQATDVVNYAQGEMAMFSTYIAWTLLDKGVPVALGSAHSPGRNGITSMPLVISLAISAFGMSVTEALRAATVGGARALRAPDRGAMARGRAADIVAWDADHEGAFAWSFGMRPIRVWRDGEPVAP